MEQTNPFTLYGQGLDQLKSRLGGDNPRYNEMLVYQQQLLENMGNSRLYGDTNEMAHRRSEIIDHLNELSLSELQVSFNELSGLRVHDSVIRLPSQDEVTKTQREKEAGQIMIVLDALKDIIAAHVDAIDEVVAPILEREDFPSTYVKFQKLVKNPVFPRSYAESKEFLIQARYHGQFREGEIHNLLGDLIHGLTNFQGAVFMKGQRHGGWDDSYRMAEAFKDAMKLWKRMSSPDNSDSYNRQVNPLKTKVRKAFKQTSEFLASVEQQTSFDTINLNTSDDVINLVSAWCEAWQIYVKRTLYERGNLDRAMSAVRWHLQTIL